MEKVFSMDHRKDNRARRAGEKRAEKGRKRENGGETIIREALGEAGREAQNFEKKDQIDQNTTDRKGAQSNSTWWKNRSTLVTLMA